MQYLYKNKKIYYVILIKFFITQHSNDIFQCLHRCVSSKTIDYPSLPLEPQRGRLTTAQGATLGPTCPQNQALKGRHGRNRYIAMPPLQGSLKIPRHTQGVALGYKYAAPLGLCGDAMPHVLLFLVCKSLPRRQLHGPAPFVGAFTPHLPARHAGRVAFASKQHRRPTFSRPPGFAARAPTGRLTTAQGATLGPNAHKSEPCKGGMTDSSSIAMPPLQGSLKIPRHTQGVALGYKYAAPLGLCGGAMPHVLLFPVCKSLPRRQLHGPTPFVGAFTPHLPARHAGRVAFASK